MGLVIQICYKIPDSEIPKILDRNRPANETIHTVHLLKWLKRNMEIAVENESPRKFVAILKKPQKEKKSLVFFLQEYRYKCCYANI